MRPAQAEIVIQQTTAKPGFGTFRRCQGKKEQDKSGRVRSGQIVTNLDR